MESLILLVAVLVCPVVMGTAMLLMWREMRRGHSPPPPEEQAEIQKRDEAHARHA